MDEEDFCRLFKNCMPLFIALSDEVRLTIIQTLGGTDFYGLSGSCTKNSGCAETLVSTCPGMNVKEITERTSLSRPAISHHLKILKDAGLVNVRREGTSNYYFLTMGDGAGKLCSLGQHLQDNLVRIS